MVQAAKGEQPAHQGLTGSIRALVSAEAIEDQGRGAISENREEGRQREEADLVAQQGMNDAAQRMADYAKWQTIATWIGSFLVAGTLVLMIQTNRAAVHSVKNQREIGRAQVRAYLAPFHMPFRPILAAGGRNIVALELQVGFKNVGQSPAMALRIKGETFFHDPSTGGVSFKENVDLAPAEAAILGPGIEGKSSSNEITIGDLVKAKQNGFRIITAMYYSFVDVFDDRHSGVLAIEALPVENFNDLVAQPIENVDGRMLFLPMFIR